MVHRLKLGAVFLAYLLTIASGIPTQFPHGKTLVYNYYGDVKAGLIEPAPYASQFAIAGQLHIKHDTSDPNLPYAYYAALTDVKTGMHNGIASHFERTEIINSIPEAAKVIEQPFLIVNNEKGELQGVKISESEAGWSKNMKMAIATMLQLDLINMKLDFPMEHHGFMSKEKTIQGECWISYTVHEKLPLTDEKNFIVTKFGSPENCTRYNVHQFDFMESEECGVPREAPVNIASRRVFDVEHQGDNVLIKSLIAHGGVNYFPLNGRSEAHYVLNNASFVLEKIVPSSEIKLSPVDFQAIPLVNDLSYKRPENNHGGDGAVDYTQGRHTVNQEFLVSVVQKILTEAVDYLEEFHLDLKEPNYKHGQTLNRILHQMGYMTKTSIEKVYSFVNIPDPSRKTVTAQNILLGIIPRIGTTASTLFVKDLIINNNLHTIDAQLLLSTLASNVRNPSQELLNQMEDFISCKSNIKVPVRQSAILCFASMIYRTYKDVPNANINEKLHRYLDIFYENLINTTSYEMKVTYLNAIRNVRVGNIVEYLRPIIRGDLQLSDKPVHLRLMAIWAVEKAIANNYNDAHNLLWPIMADYNTPLKLRIAAYDILIRQMPPTMTNILHIYWFMVYEKNEHLYNYHYTTIKGLANSVNPCTSQLRELTMKIMRFTRIHTPVTYSLSSSYMVNSMDEIYNHGEQFSWSMTLSEVTGLPEVIRGEFITIEGRKPVSQFSIQLHLEGFDHIYRHHMESIAIVIGTNKMESENVLKILRKAANEMPKQKDMHIDVVMTHGSSVTFARSYDRNTLISLYNTFGNLMDATKIFLRMNKQFVSYLNIYEQYVISEMGLPILLATKIPNALSMKFSQYTPPSGTDTQFGIDLRLWRHGEYYMSIYNPFIDVWHSVRRSSAVDVLIPLRLHLNLRNSAAVASIILQSEEKSESAMGVRVHTKDLTTVTEDEMNTLKITCPTCQYHEIVSNGRAAKKYYLNQIDLKHIGLQFRSAIYDCENEITPIHLQKEWMRFIVLDHENSWNNVIARQVLGIRLFLKNILLSPPMGSCGILAKIERSEDKPISRIQFSFNIVRENKNNTLDHYLLTSESKSYIATVETFSELTGKLVRSWNLTVDINSSEGHINNRLNVKLVCKTRGEGNLVICIDADKIYPAIPTLNLNDAVITNINISMAHTKENIEFCSRDEMVIDVTIKGELSDEQKRLITHDATSGACKKDIDNPLMKSPVNLIPQTVHCLDEAIRNTTLRKYAIDITYKNVPSDIISNMLALEAAVKATSLENIRYMNNYVEPGSINITVEVSAKDRSIDALIITPLHSYNLLDVGLDSEYPPPHNGFGPDFNKYLWMFPLDNTYFSTKMLQSYVSNRRKICSIFPKIILNLDGGEILYDVPHEWTLVSGDYVDEQFAVFVKNVDNRISLKIYVHNQTLEIIPQDVGFQVSIPSEDDVPSRTYTKGTVRVPSKFCCKSMITVLVNEYESFIQLKESNLEIILTGNSAILLVNNVYQGVLAGICGRMTGDYKFKMPQEYILSSASA